MADRLVDIGVRPAKVHVVVNTPSLAQFDPAPHSPTGHSPGDGTVRLVYAGALTPTYEMSVVLDAFARLCADRPEMTLALDVYGRGDAEAGLREQAARLASRTACPSTGGSRSTTSRRRSPAPTSASPRRAATRSPMSASRRRSSSTPRWRSRSSRRACRWWKRPFRRARSWVVRARRRLGTGGSDQGRGRRTRPPAPPASQPTAAFVAGAKLGGGVGRVPRRSSDRLLRR